jgi:hypothetical protein
MSLFIDRTGERIGYITITKLSQDVYRRPDGKTSLKWEYICDCGNVGSFVSHEFNKRKNAHFKTSCGCNQGGFRDRLLLNEAGFNDCYKCKKTLPISEFGKNKSTKNGLQRYCRSCKSENDKKYRNDPRFRQRILDSKMEDYWKIRNNPIEWETYLENQRETRDYKEEYQQIQNDPFRKAKDAIRKTILAALKVRNISKSKLCKTTEEIVGCSFMDFKQHIESQFQKGMSWKNHGEWHLDHKIPLASHEDLDELIKLNHWTNFQPLWAKDNMKKGDSYIEEEKQRFLDSLK